ncbi:hypothetical protein [Pseudomonas sp. 1 R 17]|uniref:hypothetical protein n=1 Tax=Pseudomonas sp. 1 R 17 TaxID=1844091 RepID=UPI0008128A66|nr:hypothetical protein [Pseudomonas sp. 1 R 17]SAM35789.1 hypothetical protein BN1864_LIB5394:05836 [Pseudomonas sp. 1 R 17]
MKEKSSSTNSGIGILGLLGVMFVGLKLTGYIDWSWWYVTMPFWGGLAIALAIMLLILIGWLLSMALNSKR